MSTQATKDSYSRQAKKYEERWRKYLAHTHEVVLQELDLAPNAIVLDVSAGTGLFQQRMLKRSIPFQKMVLNDPSEGMLEVAKARFSPDDRFSFSHQKAEDLGFPDNSFDAILSLNSFHNYGGQEKVVEEWQRVLRPGGKVFLLDWNNSGLFRPVNAIIAAVVPEIIKTWSATEMKNHLIAKRFKVKRQSEWWYTYTWWKFYFIIAEKK